MGPKLIQNAPLPTQGEHEDAEPWGRGEKPARKDRLVRFSGPDDHYVRLVHHSLVQWLGQPADLIYDLQVGLVRDGVSNDVPQHRGQGGQRNSDSTGHHTPASLVATVKRRNRSIGAFWVQGRYQHAGGSSCGRRV
jgi:hypothetical protein